MNIKFTVTPRKPSQPALNMYRLRGYGDPIMVKEMGLDIHTLYPPGVNQDSNFQDHALWNSVEKTFDPLTNVLKIPMSDFKRIASWQPSDGYTASQKLDWLLDPTGALYTGEFEDSYVLWGSLGLGHNLVQVKRFAYQDNVVNWVDNIPRRRIMAELVAFRRTDFAKPIEQLIAEGLVHRCYCVYKGRDGANIKGDSPVGIVYSPMWSPLDWTYKYSGFPQPESWWTCADWLMKI